MAAASFKPLPGPHCVISDGGALLRVCDLPIAERLELCRRLDADGGWKDMADAAGLSAIDVGLIESRCARSYSSPADQLLTMWSQRNVPRVLELYVALHEKKRVFEAQLIENHVPSKYRVQITRPQYSMQLFTATDVLKEKVGQLQPKQLPPFAPPSPRKASDPSPNGDAGASSASGIRAGGATSQASPVGIAQRLAIPEFSYEELLASTRKFSDECLLGQGRFSRVYKCTMRNTTYAVKVKAAKGADRSGLDAELDLMQSYPHENILPIYGYCLAAESVFLCCQFMANGSLADWLSSTAAPLLCEQRCHIAVGSAKGLQYLHSLRDQPVIHGNVKSSNILLDKYLEAKLSDFSLARCATSGSSTGTAAPEQRAGPAAAAAAPPRLTHYTRQDGDPFGADAAYTAPELMEAVGCVQPSIKSDAYSFGIVLLEICTGLRASGAGGGRAPDWLRSYVAGVCSAAAPAGGSGAAAAAAEAKLRLADPRMPWDRAFFLELLELAQSCCSHLKKHRPDMGQVFASLQRFDVGLQIRQRAAAESAPAILQGPAACDRPAGDSHLLLSGYELHGGGYGSSISTSVATLSVDSLTSVAGFSIPSGIPSVSKSSHVADEDRCTSPSWSSGSVSDFGSSSVGPNPEPLRLPNSNRDSGASATRLALEPSEASDTPGDGCRDAAISGSSLSIADQSPLSAYMNEYGADAGGTGDSEDADLLLQGFDAFSLSSNVPTESGLDDWLQNSWPTADGLITSCVASG